ncbi:alpha/beta fold hydrolase [bacterium]|nr:alpha/beta fold hydrolase [bacterium]
MSKLLNAKVFGEGKPLIILHGLFGMLDNWQGLAKEFGQFFETHILDQRNHGKSFHSDFHSYDLMCEDLLAYLEEKKIDKLYLVGHSMGGKVAMLFACKYPSRVEKLVVVDIGPKQYPPHHQQIILGLNAVHAAKVHSRKEADTLLSNYFPQTGVRQFLLKNLYWQTPGNLAFKFNLPVLSKEIYKIGEALYETAIFNKPTLFISGEQSNYITKEDEALIETHFPDLEIVEIKNAGHWVHAESPVEFFELVSRYLIY